MSSLTFTIIQTALHWEDKKANLEMLEEKINSISQKTEVVILPEMFSTGFSMKPEELAEGMDGESVAWMKRVSAQKKIILTGSLIIEQEDRYLNRLVWMLPNGQMGLYDKRHLFAYAHEDEHYTAGSKRLIASVKGWKINLLVCYDLRFPVWSRQARHGSDRQQGPEYDVLIYVANWPEKRGHMWRTLLQARAIENQCFCIGVNRVGKDGNGIQHSGDSMVVNPLGEVLYHKVNDEDIYTFTLQKDDLIEIREKMPFWKDADPFLIIPD
ncbi:amidohydrolase [Segetibacter aerophilus]|uniref:Omega-amidase YafV n=1 Tax=Segetibacter aerophilus TaxID=670293 RepID=A0A512BCN6_9BACT|nr:amidohydrolase [Segetibacter aerophilus]GEO09721.1 amidohydrolase [Segetibacter aerophilus]